MSDEQVRDYLQSHFEDIQNAADNGNRKAQRVINTIGKLFDPAYDALLVRTLRDELTAAVLDYVDGEEREL